MPLDESWVGAVAGQTLLDLIDQPIFSVLPPPPATWKADSQ